MNRLRCLGRLFFVSGVVLGIALHSLPRGAYAQPRSETLPLADLHFHAERGLAPDAVLGAMDRAGVRWAGNGAKGADALWRPFVEAAQDRFLPPSQAREPSACASNGRARPRSIRTTYLP